MSKGYLIAHLKEHDQEGRVLTAEYDDFYLTTVYTPNSKNDLSRLDDRQNFDAAFLAYLKNTINYEGLSYYDIDFILC